MSNSSFLGWENYLLKWAYSPENKRDPFYEAFRKINANSQEFMFKYEKYCSKILMKNYQSIFNLSV